MSARTVRYHYPDGSRVVERLEVTARGNGLEGRTAGAALVAAWEAAGDLERRPDGGYDVIRQRPRPDVERANTVRKQLKAAR